MNNVIDFPEKFYYRMDENNCNIFAGVGCPELIIDNLGESKVNIIVFDAIDKSDLKQLMIMWLSLNYPEVLKYDDDVV